MRVLMVGGRSGGHVYALIAVAGVLEARRSDCEFLFVGEKGRMEEDFVPRAGYPLRTLPMPTGTHVLARVASLSRWYRLYRSSLSMVDEFRPDVVLGSGGQVCLPVMLAARRRRVPSMLLEANAVPGWSNRLAARLARPQLVGLLFPEARTHWPAGQRLEMTGYPLRSEILDTTRAEGMAELGLDPRRQTLLVFGGSQGSAHLNQVLGEWLTTASPSWAEQWQILHLGGWINASSAPQGQPMAVRYHYLPYLHDMQYALAVADLVLGRAGATSLAELTALGLPAILVPLEGVADNHQVHNARWMGDAGAAVVLTDSQFGMSSLSATLDRLCSAPDHRSAMARASAGLGQPRAAERVAELLCNLAENR